MELKLELELYHQKAQHIMTHIFTLSPDGSVTEYVGAAVGANVGTAVASGTGASVGRSVTAATGI